MPSPFALSLEKYASLWKPLPYGQIVRLGQPPDEISRHAVNMVGDFIERDTWWVSTNDLRYLYAQSDPAKSRLYLAWMLQFDNSSEPEFRHHDYVLNLMSGGMRGKDNAKAVRNLLDTALKSRGYSLIEIACLLEAAQICFKYQMPLQARRLCAACFVRQEYGSPPANVLAFYRKLAAQTPVRPLPSTFQPSFNPLKHEDELLVRCFLEDFNISDIAPKVLEASQAVIGIKPRKNQTASYVTSHLGGVPDVEENWLWPKGMEFLAQCNLEELAPYNINGVLPKRGLLRFFMRNLAYGAEGDWFRVEFYEGDLAALNPAKVPAFLTDLRVKPDYRNEDVVYKEVQVYGVAGSQLVVSEQGWDDQNIHDQADELVGFLASALEAERNQGEAHQMLGVASSEAFSPKPGDENEWVLLFAIDSCDQAEMMFSDAGTMYFYMKKEHLLERRFDLVELSMTNG